MLVGVPKEIKTEEHRVGMVPGGVRELTSRGHQVLMETGAGAGINCDDAEYRAAGARIAKDATEVFAAVDMIVKVKEPQAAECTMLRPGQILFTYLHLAADAAQKDGLLKSGGIAIAYETVTGPTGGLPLLAPMSEVAGRMSVQVGAHCLEKARGGRGVLLGGVPGVEPGHVVVIGGGISGLNAARMAMGLGARTTVIDNSINKLREIDALFGGRIQTLYSTRDAIERQVRDADLVIGAVLVPGATAPKLVDRKTIAAMRPGSVVVDIAIDQGGCFETSKPTTHSKPTYEVDGVVHYCVTNMPGAVPRTSTYALTNATLPFVLALADKGYKKALTDDAHLALGLNVHKGVLTHPEVARAFNEKFVPTSQAVAA
jgi:alanine dehydrogenase